MVEWGHLLNAKSNQYVVYLHATFCECLSTRALYAKTEFRASRIITKKPNCPSLGHMSYN